MGNPLLQALLRPRHRYPTQATWSSQMSLSLFRLAMLNSRMKLTTTLIMSPSTQPKWKNRQTRYNSQHRDGNFEPSDRFNLSIHVPCHVNNIARIRGVFRFMFDE